MLEDMQAASVPVAHYDAIEAAFPEGFYDGGDGLAPSYEAQMADLDDPTKLIKHAVEMAREADAAFVKIKMPTEWVKNLRASAGYPDYYPLMLSAVRETIRPFNNDGPLGAYVRETEHYDKYLPREWTFPQEITKVPKKERPKKILDNLFDPTLKSWLDCEENISSNFWENIPKTFNHNVLYAPEVDGSLFPKSHGPFNMNGMIGCLKEAFKSQGNIPGIFTNVVYFGRARSSFPWHSEDFELISANYHHLGAGKIWYGLAPSQKDLSNATFRDLYRQLFDKCPQEPRHKRLFTLPQVLENAHIKVTKTIQRPGDLLITAPWGYHMGFSLGLCVTEAVNYADEDINPKLIEQVHQEDLYCQCAYMVTGVILDYQVYSVNGHIHTIAKQREQIANMQLRIAELERGRLVSALPSPGDGLVPSTSSAAREAQERQSSDFGADDFGYDDYTFAAPSPIQGPSGRCSRVKRRRISLYDSDDEAEDDPAAPARRDRAVHEPEGEDSDNDDGRVPSVASTTTAKRGWNPFSQKEKDALTSRLIADGIYDMVSDSFTDAYDRLPARKKPTGTTYWKRCAESGDLSYRNADACRSYFRNNFDYPR